MKKETSATIPMPTRFDLWPVAGTPNASRSLGLKAAAKPPVSGGKLQAVGLVCALLAFSSPVLADGTVTLAADPWCPHTCETGADNPGYMVEVAARAFATQGYRLVYKNYSWTRVMAEVRDGKLDGAIGALRGEAADLVLPKEAAGLQINTFAIRSDDPWTYQGLSSLQGRVIAINQDYSYSEDLDEWLLKKQTPIQALGGENALERNLKKLTSRRVDVVIEDQAVLNHALASHKPTLNIRAVGSHPGGQLYIAFTAMGPTGRRLADAYDAGIQTLRQSGELKVILEKYKVKDWADAR